MIMKIYLATDHAGYEMKEEVKLFLEVEKDDILSEFVKNGIVVQDIEIVDFGAFIYDENDDYPKYISSCAGALSADIYTGIKNNFGIVFGGSGEGEAMLSDKYKGVRAGVVNSENIELVKLLREHNNANILSVGARFVSLDFIKQAIKVFLFTKFDNKDIENENQKEKENRHERRIKQIEEIEEKLNTKITGEGLEELKILESMRQKVSDS